MAYIPNCPKCNKPLPLTKVQSTLKSQHGKMITCLDIDNISPKLVNGRHQHKECESLPRLENYRPYSYETNAKGEIVAYGANKK